MNLNITDRINKSKPISIKHHVLFWLCWFAFMVVRWGSYYQDYWYSFKSNIVTVSMSMLLAYVNIYILYPKFILTKKILTYIFFFFVALLLFYVVRTELIFTFINENVWPESQTPQQAYSFNHIIIVFLIGIYDVALVSTIKLTSDWIIEKKRIENLESLQLQTELKFLKAQIQPHFFFNTLNNLYALTMSKSSEAPDVVLKLSEIMEYVLYDAKAPKIKLFNELRYIKNYVDLEKLRYGDKVNVIIKTKGDIENNNIPPLLLLPFVENCFKHGSVENYKLNINIMFEVTEDNVFKFSVENNYNSFIKKVTKHGIGNENVRRRLELLYKDNFILTTKADYQLYFVYLEIQL